MPVRSASTAGEIRLALSTTRPVRVGKTGVAASAGVAKTASARPISQPLSRRVIGRYCTFGGGGASKVTLGAVWAAAAAWNGRAGFWPL